MNNFAVYALQHQGHDTAVRLADFSKLEPDHVIIRDELANIFVRYISVVNFIADYEQYTNIHHAFCHEVLRANCIQRARFDLDIKCDIAEISDILERAQSLVDEIIRVAIGVYEYDYHNDRAIDEDLFVICSSHGEHENSYKASFHLITPFYGTYETISGFTEAIHRKLATHTDFKFIDTGVTKSTQNFRLPLSFKLHSNRIKEVHEAEWHHALIGHYRADLQPIVLLKPASPMFLPTRFVNNQVFDNPLIVDALTEMLRQTMPDFDKTWIFRNERSGFFNFRRIAPSHCQLCNRTHERDHTLYITIGSYESKPVYMHCHKSKDSTKIGHLNNDRSYIAEARAEYIQNAIDEIIEDPPPEYVANPNIVQDLHFEPELKPFPRAANLYVRANMKMGKTKAIIEYIDRYKPQSIVYVSFRQTFSNAIAANLAHLNFESYQAINEAQIILGAHPRLIIQVESLMRLRQDIPVDLLVLDESESILAQFSSAHVKNLSLTYGRFRKLVSSATHVVCMDANLDERTINIIEKERKTNEIIVNPGYPRSIFYNNWYQNAVEDQYTLLPSRDNFIDHMIASIRNGLRIVICTNSLDDAKCYMRAIKNLSDEFVVEDITGHLSDADNELLPKLTVALYSSETSPTIKNRHFSDVHEFWSRLNVLIYTPTVTAGVSFELPHFDVLYGSFTSFSCDVETCRQMMGRVRDIRTRQHYLCLDGDPKAFPTDRNIIANQAERAEVILGIATSAIAADNDNNIVRLPPFDLIVENIRHVNISRNNFVARFIIQLRKTGAVVTVAPSDTKLASGSAFGLREQYTQEEAELVSNAVELTEPRYVEIRRAIDGGNTPADQIITSDDMYAYRKYRLITNYEMTPVDITPNFVLTFDSKQLMSNYRNLVKYKPAIQFLGMTMPRSTIAQIYQQITETQPAKNEANRYYYYLHQSAVEILTALNVTHFTMDTIAFEPDVFAALISKWTGAQGLSAMKQQLGLDSKATQPRTCAAILKLAFGSKLTSMKKRITIRHNAKLLQLIMCGKYWDS